MIYLDHALALIDDQLASPIPERGGVLLGSAGSPFVADVILDPPARASAPVWQMHPEIARSLREREEADPAVRLAGTIHSHPAGLDRPSSQDVVATVDLLRRNPSLGRAHLHIVTRWADLPSDAPDRLGAHELGLTNGKVSCYSVLAPARGEPGRASAEAARSLPLYEHARALAGGTGSNVVELSVVQVDGVLHAAAALAWPTGDRLHLLAPPGYPTSAPMLLWLGSDGVGDAARLIPLVWGPSRSGVDRLLTAVDVDMIGRNHVADSAPPSAATASGHDEAEAERGLRVGPVSGSFTDRVVGPLGGSVGGQRVVIAGLGSVGSTFAEFLTRTGVDQFSLVDPELVEMPNLSRTIYDRDDVGRAKTLAVADHLRAVNPEVHVDLVDRPIQALSTHELIGLIGGAALVVAATDDPEAQARINAVSFASGIPAVFLGLYARAAAGEVILTVPGHTRCYRCAAPVRGSQPDRPSSDYGSGRLQGEPALGCDIARVVAMGTRMALALLAIQAGADTALTRHLGEVLGNGEQFLITSTEPRWGLFERLLAEVPGQHGYGAAWMSVAPNPDCDICGDHPIDLEAILPTADREVMSAAIDAMRTNDTISS